MRYGYRVDANNQLRPYRAVGTVSVTPHWNSRDQAVLGTFADGSWRKCETISENPQCVWISWPELWAGYARPRRRDNAWHGSLLEDKSDASGLSYRRNRYYDPATGRFTQEDPIGLAGGLNLYGFAAGDPVNYADPYGLSAEGSSGCDAQEQAARGLLCPLVVRARARPRPRMRFQYLARAERDLGRFMDRAQQVRLSGHREFPGEENSHLRHACASYVMTDEYGAWPTRITGFANELQGFARWDLLRLPSRLQGRSVWAFQMSDLQSNEVGISHASMGHQLPLCERVRNP
jgi:RHS repeat-associated protein